jgi:hypothetical protein
MFLPSYVCIYIYIYYSTLAFIFFIFFRKLYCIVLYCTDLYVLLCFISKAICRDVNTLKNIPLSVTCVVNSHSVCYFTWLVSILSVGVSICGLLYDIFLLFLSSLCKWLYGVLPSQLIIKKLIIIIFSSSSVFVHSVFIIDPMLSKQHVNKL